MTLSDAHLRFSITQSIAFLQEDSSNFVLPYEEVTACRLGRLLYVLKTVNLETTRHGLVRFRCQFARNERLLEDLRMRMT